MEPTTRPLAFSSIAQTSPLPRHLSTVHSESESFSCGRRPDVRALRVFEHILRVLPGPLPQAEPLRLERRLPDREPVPPQPLAPFPFARVLVLAAACLDRPTRRLVLFEAGDEHPLHAEDPRDAEREPKLRFPVTLSALLRRDAVADVPGAFHHPLVHLPPHGRRAVELRLVFVGQKQQHRRDFPLRRVRPACHRVPQPFFIRPPPRPRRARISHPPPAPRPEVPYLLLARPFGQNQFHFFLLFKVAPF